MRRWQNTIPLILIALLGCAGNAPYGHKVRERMPLDDSPILLNDGASEIPHATRRAPDADQFRAVMGPVDDAEQLISRGDLDRAAEERLLGLIYRMDACGHQAAGRFLTRSSDIPSRARHDD